MSTTGAYSGLAWAMTMIVHDCDPDSFKSCLARGRSVDEGLRSTAEDYRQYIEMYGRDKRCTEMVDTVYDLIRDIAKDGNDLGARARHVADEMARAGIVGLCWHDDEGAVE